MLARPGGDLRYFAAEGLDAPQRPAHHPPADEPDDGQQNGQPHSSRRCTDMMLRSYWSRETTTAAMAVCRPTLTGSATMRTSCAGANDESGNDLDVGLPGRPQRRLIVKEVAGGQDLAVAQDLHQPGLQRRGGG